MKKGSESEKKELKKIEKKTGDKKNVKTGKDTTKKGKHYIAE